MAFSGSFMAGSFKSEILQAIHNLSAVGGDTFKIALYTNAATMDATTTTYSTVNEVVGTNYVAGGVALTNSGPQALGAIGFSSFGNATFANVSITARGALIYNSSKANRVVCVLDFGADKSATAGGFIITMPASTSTTALLRLT